MRIAAICLLIACVSACSSEDSSSAKPPRDAAVDARVGDVCEGSALRWRSARKTNYTSYPDPGSDECVKFNGCMWAGQFSACDDKKSKAWVEGHNIVAMFPDFKSLKLHDLCLRAWSHADGWL